MIQLVASQFEDAGVPALEERDTQRAIFATGSAAGLFAALVGVLSVTGEFRHGTIRPTLLFSPARARCSWPPRAWPARSPASSSPCSPSRSRSGSHWTWLQIDDVEQSLGQPRSRGDSGGNRRRRPSSGRSSASVSAPSIRNQVAAILGDDPVGVDPASRSCWRSCPIVGPLHAGGRRATPLVAARRAGELLSPLAGLLVLGSLGHRARRRRGRCHRPGAMPWAREPPLRGRDRGRCAVERVEHRADAAERADEDRRVALRPA